MADYYFSSTAGGSTDPTNSAVWFDDVACTNAWGQVPTTYDDVYIQEGTCDTSSFSYASLTVVAGAILTLSGMGYTVGTNNGTITTNDGTVTTNASGGTVAINNSGGTVGTNSSGGTVGTNSGTVTTNNGTITTRSSGGLTTNEYEAANIPAGYSVGNLYVPIETNDGTISTNNGTISTNNATVMNNNATVATNADSGMVTNNFSPSGLVQRNNGTVTTNNGTVKTDCRIGGGTGSLATTSGTLNLSAHSVGAGVTLPSPKWW